MWGVEPGNRRLLSSPQVGFGCLCPATHGAKEDSRDSANTRQGARGPRKTMSETASRQRGETCSRGRGRSGGSDSVHRMGLLLLRTSLISPICWTVRSTHLPL